MRKTLFLFAAVCVAGSLFASEALKIAAAPKLDGKLDEPFWKDAKPLGDFQLWDGPDKGKPTAATDVRLAYDNTWFYIGLKCDNPLQKLVLAPKIKDHDGAVHLDESVELFLTSDEKNKVYYHFVLSCFNVKAEQRFLDGVRERETWNLPWRSATAINDNGWTAEIAIPLYLFLEHGDFEHLRLNIVRDRRCPFMDACKVITHETTEHSVWRPTLNSFHELSAFGPVAALAPDKLQVPFLPAIENVEIKPYFIKNGASYYRADLTLKGDNPTAGEVELVVTDRTVNGAATAFRRRVALKGTTPETPALEIPAPTPAERAIAIEIRDLGGETLQSLTIENPPCLKVMTAYLDRNYYTTETEAVAVAEIALPEETVKNMNVAVMFENKIVASAPATSETMVKFPIQALSVGTRPLAIALRRQDGAPFFSVAAELIKRASKPGREVKIDQINRVVLKNGEPFFPFGPVMYGVTLAADTDFKTIADAGCNTFFQWHRYGPPEDAGRFADTAKKYGLALVSLPEIGWPSYRDSALKTPARFLDAKEAAEINSQWQSGSVFLRCFLMTSTGTWPAKTAVFGEYFDKCVPYAETAVKSVMDADNLLAYNSFDEPCENRFFHITKYLKALYDLIRRVDGYHPTMLLYSSHIGEGDEYVEPCDILCTDPYWIPGGDLTRKGRNEPNFVSNIVAENDRLAAKSRKAVWTVPLAWHWSGCRKRGITGPEQDCQNFLAIIHGSRGLFWFRYPMPDLAWKNLSASCEKIKVIGPMAVQPKVAQQVRYLRAAEPEKEYKDAAFVPEKDEFPDVHGRIFRDPKGGLVLLVANSRYYPVTTTVTVAGLSGEVSELFGGAALTVTDGAFAEKLGPFAVRAWRLGDALKEPVALTIAALRSETLPPPETTYADNVRPGKKNIFPNPSFEEETVPGAADYYFGFGSDGATLISDAAGAKFGKNYVNLSHDSNRGYAQVYWTCEPKHDKDTAYVWSLWAKGVKGGEKISVGGKTFALTADWARYSLPVVIPAHGSPWPYYSVRLIGRGEAYLDGLQLEQANQPSPFEE